MPKPPVPERTVDGSKLHNLGQRKLSKGRFITHQDYKEERPFSLSGFGGIFPPQIGSEGLRFWRLISLAKKPKYVREAGSGLCLALFNLGPQGAPVLCHKWLTFPFPNSSGGQCTHKLPQDTKIPDNQRPEPEPPGQALKKQEDNPYSCKPNEITMSPVLRAHSHLSLCH